jgi:hypothetical protein
LKTQVHFLEPINRYYILTNMSLVNETLPDQVEISRAIVRMDYEGQVLKERAPLAPDKGIFRLSEMKFATKAESLVYKCSDAASQISYNSKPRKGITR